jgi:hypothetical protein
MKPRKNRPAPKRRKPPQRKKDRTAKRREEPINLRKERVPEFSGFLILGLKPGVISDDARSLDESDRDALTELLARYNLQSQRLITSVSVQDLRNLEERARRNLEERARELGIEPRYSLDSLALAWRVDARGRSEVEWQELRKKFMELPNEVEYADLEMSASAPSNVPANFEPQQLYLDPADTGIDARSAWTQPGGKGTDMHFIDLEEGWWTHDDLPKSIDSPIFGQNRQIDLFRSHGTAVLGVIAGLDNGLGIKGIAPEATVRVVSHYNQNSNGHVADAISAALNANPVPHVLLLEVQRGDPALPTEVHKWDYAAIQTAVGSGVVVIEAAGNGGIDLDQWQDDAGQFRLNKGSGWDSFAILVGAASSLPPHQPLVDSNFGSRVDCYAWGENIVTTGWTGDLTPGITNNKKKYTGTFGGTSGASSIIAGAALLVQGVYFQKPPKGRLLSSLQMRAFLSAQALGTPIAKTTAVMPDLQRIIPNLPP